MKKINTLSVLALSQKQINKRKYPLILRGEHKLEDLYSHVYY